MKKTCNGCKALVYARPNWSCSKGYTLDEIKGIPLEECPKPLTNVQLCKTKHKTIKMDSHINNY